MIAALLVLSIIILFHEFGHFLLARINKITVVEFSLGFGPRLLTHVSKKSGTRYSVKLFPLGGSCAMLGEFEGEEEEKEEGSFFSKSPLARMSVIAAGPIFNFILALVFSVVLVAWCGYDPPEIHSVEPGLAAEEAGLKAGDVITKIGNRRVMITRDMILYMMVNGNEDVEVQYKRLDGVSGKWEKKTALLKSENFVYQSGRYMAGIQFSGSRAVSGSPAELMKYAVAEVRYSMISVVDSLKEMVKGHVEAENIAGPVRIVAMIDDTVEAYSPYGFMTVLMSVINLTVLFSSNLGVMNLLPFPALDGGRLVFLLWELITRKPVDQRVEGMVNMTGMALLMTFMVFVLINDLRFLF